MSPTQCTGENSAQGHKWPGKKAVKIPVVRTAWLLMASPQSPRYYC